VAAQKGLQIPVGDPPSLAYVDGPQIAPPDPGPHRRLADLQPVGDLLDRLILIACHRECLSGVVWRRIGTYSIAGMIRIKPMIVPP